MTSAVIERFTLSREGDSACDLHGPRKVVYDQFLYCNSILPIRVSFERVDRVELIRCT